MTRLASRFAASILLIGVTMLASAEAQSRPEIREQMSVTVIEVPVTVVDREGNPVRGLAADDFELIDRGVKREITWFETIDLAAAQRTDRIAKVNPVARLHAVLLFDLTNSSPINLGRAREAAKKFVSEHLRDHDLALVATYSTDHGFRILTSFTSNRELLLLAVETLGNPKYFKVGDPLFLSARANEGDGGAETRGGAVEEAADEWAQISQELDQMTRASHDEYLRARLETQLENFGTFARTLDQVRGRKQVILLSEGFDPRFIQGVERDANEGSRELDYIASGQPWRVDLDRRYGFSSSKTQLGKMAELFRRSDVVLHAIDIKGVRSDVDARSGYGRVSNEGLFLMTRPTGGQVFKNANDLETNFRRIMQQQEVVYVLAFRAPAGKEPGAFHPIEVKVKNRGAMTVTHRAGYYEPGGPSSPLERTLTRAEMVLHDLAPNDLAIETLAVPFRQPDGESVVPVIVEIPGAELLSGVRGAKLTADLFVYAFDEEGAVRDFLHQKIELDLLKVRAVVEHKGLKFYGSLRLPPGSYGVKVLLETPQSERRGFARRDVTVSGPGEEALLPPLVFEPDNSWILIKGRDQGSAYPFHVALESFVPAAAPTLEPEGVYRLALFAYDIDYRSATLQAAVRAFDGSRGDAEFSIVGQAGGEDGEASKLMLDFDFSKLDPGRYYLDVALLDEEGNVDHSTTLPFRVEKNRSN